MPRDINDPNFLRFMIENMDKEQEKRLLWFTKNMEKVKKSAQFPEHFKDIRTADVKKANLNLCLPGLSKDYHSSMRHRRKAPKRDGTVPCLSSLASAKRDQLRNSTPKPVMLPVDPRVENILTVRLPYGGRRQYLNARSCLDPEEKYYDVETTNNVYGWRLRDSSIHCSAPKFALHSRFFRGLYSRTGPHPDPTHYQQPPRDPYSKC